MEEQGKIKLSIVIMIIILCIISFILGCTKYTYNQLMKVMEDELSNENRQDVVQEHITSTEEPDLETILDKIYIGQKFVMASDRFTKELFVSCNDTTAKLDKEGRLEVTIGDETFIVEEIDDEIIDLKLGIVNQHDGKNDINTSFVRDVFVLTKNGDVYAVNISYGYRKDLVSKILEDVVKLENVQRKGLYDDEESLPDSIVVAKKIDNTVAICDDGESDGL